MKKYLALMLMILMAFTASAMAEVTDIAYESRGIEVQATLTTPDDADAYPIVVMAHGFGGNRNESTGFTSMAEALAAQGIASIRMDFSGTGKSEEPYSENNMTNMKADVLAAVAYAKANLPVTKIGLFGFSMGGRVIMELLAEGAEADAVGLLSPAVDFGLANALGSAELAEKALAAFETEGSYAYTKKMVLSKQWYDDLTKYSYPELVDLAAVAYNGPALVIYAEDDEMLHPEASKYVAEKLNAKVLVATGGGHNYGFRYGPDDVRSTVVYGMSSYFTFVLK